jgi:hypothetical protein
MGPGHRAAAQVANPGSCDLDTAAGWVRDERRVRAEGDVRQIDAVLREGRGCKRLEAATIDDHRVEDLDPAAAVCPSTEVRRRIAADHIDLRHQGGAAPTNSVPLPLAEV